VKLPSSATATNDLSCLSSIMIPSNA